MWFPIGFYVIAVVGFLSWRLEGFDDYLAPLWILPAAFGGLLLAAPIQNGWTAAIVDFVVNPAIVLLGLWAAHRMSKSSQPAG